MTPSGASCHALAIAAPGRIDTVTLPVAEPGPGQVLVRIHACGVCGSDLRWYREGRQEAAFFGHEFSGSVVAVGAGIDDFRPGDRVAAGLARGCGECEACRRGFPNYCPGSKDQFAPGGFAEYCVVNCPGAFRPMARVPDDVDSIRATLYEPLTCALRIATRQPIAAGSRVLVIGLGAMGLLSGLLIGSEVAGATVVGADVHASRTALARELGFDAVAPIASDDAGAIRAIFADYDVVIDATGIADAFPLAVDLCRLGGTVILGGVPTGSVRFAPLPIFRKELTIVGAKGPFHFAAPDGGVLALELLRTDRLPWDRLVTRFALADADEAFRAAAGGRSLKSVITFAC